MKANLKNSVFFIFIIFGILIIYFQTFDNPIIFDSAVVLPEFNVGQLGILNAIHTWSKFFFLRIFDFELGRQFTVNSFSWLSEQFGLVAYGHNVFNVALHFINSLLVFVFLRSFYSKDTARLLSLFFAFNPAALHAVSYLFQRSQLLMLFCGLLQCIFYLSALSSKKVLSPIFLFLSFYCFKLACISKEHAIIFLSVYPILSIAFRQYWKRSVFYLIILLSLFVIFKSEILSKIITNIRLTHEPEYYREILESSCDFINDKTDIFFRSVSTQMGLFFRYFTYWAIPLKSSIDMRVHFSETINYFNIILFSIFTAISIYLLIKDRTRFLGCGLLIAVCFFVPELTRTRIGEMFVLYRSYIYSLGYLIALGWFVERVNIKLIFIPYLIVLFGSSFFLAQTFNSEAKAWVNSSDLIDLRDTNIACQGGRAYNNAGAALLMEGRLNTAAVYFEKAIALSPQWELPLSNLAVTNYYRGDYEKASSLLEKVLKSAQSGEMIDRHVNRNDMIENSKRILKNIELKRLKRK